MHSVPGVPSAMQVESMQYMAADILMTSSSSCQHHDHLLHSLSIVPLKCRLLGKALQELTFHWAAAQELQSEADGSQRLLQELPRLAAQHLLDGFTFELMDGEAGLPHQDWFDALMNALRLGIAQLQVHAIAV